jgi:hypothetical protein
MTDRQRLLIALLSENDATDTDLRNMGLLELTTALDLAAPRSARAHR